MMQMLLWTAEGSSTAAAAGRGWARTAPADQLLLPLPVAQLHWALSGARDACHRAACGLSSVGMGWGWHRGVGWMGILARLVVALASFRRGSWCGAYRFHSSNAVRVPCLVGISVQRGAAAMLLLAVHICTCVHWAADVLFSYITMHCVSRAACIGQQLCGNRSPACCGVLSAWLCLCLLHWCAAPLAAAEFLLQLLLSVGSSLAHVGQLVLLLCPVSFAQRTSSQQVPYLAAFCLTVAVG